MEFTTLLLSGHLILIFVTAFSPDENLNTECDSATDNLDDFNLSADIIPKYYGIKLIFMDIEKDIFQGSCNISIEILKDTRNIRLHSANLNIIDFTLIIEHEFKHKPCNITYINRYEIVSLDFNHKLLHVYHYTLNIIFTGIISNTGRLFQISYINKEGHREWFVATDNWKIGTRRLFPCWDEPRFKANFSITLQYHDSYTAFSNMPTVSIWPEIDIIVTRFATTPPIPTYLIAIVLMRLSIINTYSINYKLWSRPQATEHLTYAVSAIRKFTQDFKNKWSHLADYSNDQHIAIPGWLDDGIDKWHNVFYRETNIIYNDKIDPIARKIEILRLTARKVAGQWISSAISSSQWSHIWLHESISTLLGINVVNEAVPDFRMMDLFVVQTLQESLRLDNNPFMKSVVSDANNISEINSVFSFAYYLKGPVILRMLQHVLDNEMFQEGINTYLKMQLNSLDSFWTAMQAVCDKTKEPINIKETIGSWINQNYYPILNVKRNKNPFKITVSTQTADTLWIPVSYNTQTHINFNNTLPNKWLNSQIPLSLMFDDLPSLTLNDDWIIFNLQQTGYYRVNYYTENWRAIADYLFSKNYTKVHVLNRAQIIDDAFYFMITDQLEPFIFWKLTDFLLQESDYVVWYPMFKAIEYMSCSYLFHKSEDIKKIILNLLDSLLSKIKNEHSEDNPLTKCLRQEAAKWACVLGDDLCQSEAKAQLSHHLSNPKTANFLPWWKEWTYCHGLVTADVTLINKVYETYSSEKNNTKALEFLSCSNNYTHVLSLLKEVMKSYSLSNQTTRGPIYTMITKGYINMFHHIVQRYAKNEEALQYILSNWKEIKPKKISSIATLIDIINHVYSPNYLYKIKEFMKNVEEETPTFVLNPIFDVELSLNMPMIDEIIKKTYYKVLFPGVQNKINIRFSQINRHMKSFIFHV